MYQCHEANIMSSSLYNNYNLTKVKPTLDNQGDLLDFPNWQAREAARWLLPYLRLAHGFSSLGTWLLHFPPPVHTRIQSISVLSISSYFLAWTMDGRVRVSGSTGTGGCFGGFVGI